MGFALHYVFALAVVALLLLGLHAAARLYTRRRADTPESGKIAGVLESTQLTQHSAVHVVSVGGRRYLVGTGSNCVVLLADLAGEAERTG